MSVNAVVLQLLSVAYCSSLNQQIWSMIVLWWWSAPVGHSWNFSSWQGAGLTTATILFRTGKL